MVIQRRKISSTASRLLVARLSSPSAKPLRFENRFFDRIAQKPRKTIGFPGLFLTLMPFRLHCHGYRRAQNAERNIIILRKALDLLTKVANTSVLW